MSSDTIRVFLADDQALVRSGFRMLIDSEDDLEVTGEAPNGADTVAALLTSPADVVLMDIRMPVMDGVEATRRIVEAGIETHVLVLTTFDLDEYAFAALKAGASGFMLKDARPTDLLNAIRNVAEDGYDLGIVRYQADYEKYFSDTFREKGLSYRELWSFRYLAMLRVDHPAARKPAVTLGGTDAAEARRVEVRVQ